MSGDVTIQSLKRLTYLPERDSADNGDLIAGQNFYDIYFTGGTISGVTISGNIGGFTASRAVSSDASGFLISSAVTSTELGYLSGVTSSIQTQINAKLSNITGLITAGTGISLSGSGTSGSPYVINNSVSGVMSVSGTSNRITSTGGTTPVIDISASYVGQSSITTVGTLTSGTASAGFTIALASVTFTGQLSGAAGGTGVSNSGKTITIGGSFTTSGAFTTTLTVTANTNVTLPTTGTLATLAGSETLTNKTISTANNTITSASTGVQGVVQLAATSDLQTGSSTTLAVTPASVLGALGFSKLFTSTSQTITSGGALTIAHGLGREPVLIQCYLLNTTSDGGYSIGDKYLFSPQSSDGGNRGVSIVPDTTNLNIRYGSATNTFSFGRKDTGADFTATNGSWSFVIRAWG